MNTHSSNIVIGLILNQANEVLVAQRNFQQTYGGYLEFPGGKVEPNETQLDALKRELHEELGIDVMHADLIHVETSKRLYFYEIQANAWKGEPKARAGQLSLQWICKAAFESHQFPPGNRVLIDKLKEHHGVG